MCTALDVFLVLKTVVPSFFASLLSGGAHFVQARGIISHAININISHAITQHAMQPAASMARAARLSHCW